MAEEKKESPFEEARRYFSAIRAAVVSNGDVWGDFLACAARNYKYPFQDQLMIYNYRPHATACATLPMWNEPFHRRVNYKTKSIRLLNPDGRSVRHVFDIIETKPMPVYEHE